MAEEKKKIVTFGEIMLRLSTPLSQRFVQSENYEASYGGGEANVAVSLANYGSSSFFVTKLPESDLGDSALGHLRRYGVNTIHIARGGSRIGIYFLETGASMRPSKVIYDRENSAIAEAVITDFDTDAIFKDATWFHCTGITPALSENSAVLTREMLSRAKGKDITVSMDLNYRAKLWTPERAKEVMTGFMQYTDVCIGNEEDFEKCLGFKPEKTDVTKGKIDIDGYKAIFTEMNKKFKFKYIAATLRESISADQNSWSGLIYDGKEFYRSKIYDIMIVDRVGAGDAFSGGLIYGLSEGWDMKKALDFAVAASALKHTIHGDFNLVSRKEVEALLKGDSSGRVQR